MPYSSTLPISTDIDTSIGEWIEGEEEDGEAEGEEVAMVKFGEVETEFFLPFPSRRSRPTPVVPSPHPTPSVPSPHPILASTLESSSTQIIAPESLSERGDIVSSKAGKGEEVDWIGISRLNTIPPTPIKERVLLGSSNLEGRPLRSDLDLELGLDSKEEKKEEEELSKSTTTTGRKIKPNRSNSTTSTTSKINGTRSPKLIPISPILPTTTAPKLSSSPLLNGTNSSWANVASTATNVSPTMTTTTSSSTRGGGKIGPIRLAAMNGIDKLNLATSTSTSSTGSGSGGRGRIVSGSSSHSSVLEE